MLINLKITWTWIQKSQIKIKTSQTTLITASTLSLTTPTTAITASTSSSCAKGARNYKLAGAETKRAREQNIERGFARKQDKEPNVWMRSDFYFLWEEIAQGIRTSFFSMKFP